MKIKQILFTIFFLNIAIIISIPLYGQGTTTSTIVGRIIGEDGEGLVGANVICTHVPTGSLYGDATDLQGNFRVPNLQVGGPYKISFSFIGYHTHEETILLLKLGQSHRLKVSLVPDVIQMGEIIVESRGSMTGPETNLNAETISSLPTVARSLSDYTRLTPQASFTNDGGLSLAGINNRFNAVFIDGAVSNDVFGLAQSGTNGGQAGISPISIDALEQIQVVVAPFDVTLGGFAGGGINMVTKSGTNELKGSAYYYFKNENLAGKTPTDNPDAERTKLEPFDAKTYGFTLGGPIKKDKLFFFMNAEIQRDDVPKPFSFDDWEGDAGPEELEALVQKLETDYGYNPGVYLNNIGSRKGEKFLLKLNYNMNQYHKLSVRHSYVKGETVDFDQDRRPDSRNLLFKNTGIVFPSITNSTALELRSRGKKYTNNLILGYTSVRDDRHIIGDMFPRVEVTDGSGLIVFGTDAFSYTNNVEQDIYTLTDNFSWYSGKHTFTIGTHNEYFNMLNQFVIFSTPLYFYGNLDAFMNDAPAFSLFGHELPTNEGDPLRFGDDALNAGADFNAMQLAFYGQDEIQLSDNLRVTAGLRVDIPVFLDDAPQINDDFNERAIPLIEAAGYDLEGAQASRIPGSSLHLSPRVGFNYDAKGDNSLVLRGGAGVFTSRVPFVWPAGIYLRNGMTTGFSPGFGAFTTTPEEWAERANLTKPTGDVDLYSADFKFPQIFRASLGMDKELPFDVQGSFDFIYSKTINNIYLQNVNIQPSTETLDGADNRAIYTGGTVDGTYGRVIYTKNTSEGSSYSPSVSLSKAFADGNSASVAYSFTRSESIFDGFNAITSSLWRDNHSVNGRNSAGLARSGFDRGHRVYGHLTYQKELIKNFPTSITLFWANRSGQPFSYTYNDGGALTGEDSNERSLIYVPADESEIVFDELDGDGNLTYTDAEKSAMWDAFNSFVENDDYLSSHGGQYAERNFARSPFEGQLDLKIQQSFHINRSNGKRQTVEVSLDIMNVGNMINKNWGRRYFVGSTGTENKSFELLNLEGFVPGTNQPVFTFNDPGDPWDILTTGNNSARWYAQLGLRILF